jgi:hypothetical protein
MLSEQLAPKLPLSVADLTARLDAELDPRDSACIWGFRHDLARLALSTDEVWAAMVDTITGVSTHRLNGNQPSYFFLHNAPSYSLRANLWLPESTSAPKSALENAAFSYDFPHDHNFDILSVCCFGPGYETDVYTYRDGAYPDALGDIVRVQYLGRLRQPRYMAFMYEKFVDIHTQIPPEDVVVTLNLLPQVPEEYGLSQHLFENISRDALRFIGRPLSPEGRSLSAVRFAGKLIQLGLDNTGALGSRLERMSTCDPSPHVAAAAKAALEGRSYDWRLSDGAGRMSQIKYFEVAERARAWR